MGIDTKIILIPCIITDILMKTRFSVMATLIYILRGLLTDARVASFWFLNSTPQWYRNSKKNFVWTAVHAHWSLPPDYSIITAGFGAHLSINPSAILFDIWFLFCITLNWYIINATVPYSHVCTLYIYFLMRVCLIKINQQKGKWLYTWWSKKLSLNQIISINHIKNVNKTILSLIWVQ